MLKNTDFVILKWQCHRYWVQFQTEWWLITPRRPLKDFPSPKCLLSKTWVKWFRANYISIKIFKNHSNLFNIRKPKKWWSLRKNTFVSWSAIWISCILFKLWQEWFIYLYVLKQTWTFTQIIFTSILLSFKEKLFIVKWNWKAKHLERLFYYETFGLFADFWNMLRPEPILACTVF